MWFSSCLYLPQMISGYTLDPSCPEIHKDVLAFTFLIAVPFMMQVLILTVFGCQNVRGRLPSLTSMRWWYSASQAVFIGVQVLGFPIWFWVCVWDVFGVDQVCLHHWNLLDYINVIGIMLITACYAFIISLTVACLVCWSPCMCIYAYK